CAQWDPGLRARSRLSQGGALIAVAPIRRSARRSTRASICILHKSDSRPSGGFSSDHSVYSKGLLRGLGNNSDHHYLSVTEHGNSSLLGRQSKTMSSASIWQSREISVAIGIVPEKLLDRFSEFLDVLL